MSFFVELRRRNVFRVAVLYVIASWLVLQVTEVLVSLLPVPDWTGSFVFLLLVIGFPLVMIFSWVYELTPEGLKREHEVDRSQSITQQTGRKINILIIVMLALAIGAVVADRLIPRLAPEAEIAVVEETAWESPADPGDLAAEKFAPAPDRSIAVLPFVNMSPDPAQEYFSDGLSEELLNLLAKVPELAVSSRTSAFYFKSKDVTISEVAQELNVRHILEGSVRKSGDRVRITAQLIDAQRDVHLWSETWDRTLSDVFAIQDEISRFVVDALKVTLLGRAPASAQTDPKAYTLYLQARHLERQGSVEGMSKAIELFEQVLAIDPDYVPAWLGLSTAYWNLAGTGAVSRTDAYSKSREASERALAIDPDNGNGHASLAWYYDQHVGDYKEAARLYQRAMELAPNDLTVLNAVANFLQTLGRPRDAVSIFKVIAERDPVDAKLHHNLGIAYLKTRQFDEAAASFDKAVALSPNMQIARFFQAFAAYVNGDCVDALEKSDQLSEDTGSEVFLLVGQAFCYPIMNRETEGTEALNLLEERFGDSFTFVIAAIHARQGRADQAFAWLDRVYETRGPGALSPIATGVMYEPLRGDPRWLPMLEKAGVAPAQLAAIDFDVKLPN